MGRGTGAPGEALAGGAAGAPELAGPTCPRCPAPRPAFGQFESDNLFWDVGVGGPGSGRAGLTLLEARDNLGRGTALPGSGLVPAGRLGLGCGTPG